MKAPQTDYGVVELAALSALSALGCAFAAGQADLPFVALFGATSTVTIIEAATTFTLSLISRVLRSAR
jgi:hypothetical protein